MTVFTFCVLLSTVHTNGIFLYRFLYRFPLLANGLRYCRVTRFHNWPSSERTISADAPPPVSAFRPRIGCLECRRKPARLTGGYWRHDPAILPLTKRRILSTLGP